MSDPKATAKVLADHDQIAKKAEAVAAELLAFAKLLRERHARPAGDDDG